MQPQDALDDLKAIRQIMEQARRSSDGFGGWFMVLWGAIWLVGFTGTHILVQTGRDPLINWLWMPLNTLGVLGSIYLGIRMRQRAQKKSFSSIWVSIFLWWLALAAFDAAVIGVFQLRGFQIALLIVLTIALSYVLFGLFTHWINSVIGLFIGLVAIVMATWLVEYFNLAIALLGGAVLIGGGLWVVRRGG
ncbi:MAG: hypothetical protein N2508_10345 [Anaerolineae bacterium]|nr:hypothetical protein [Anaerolineae bacterium]